MSFTSDSNHFNNLQPPLAPNVTEVRVFRENINGNVLLLGFTKELRCLADACMDLNFPPGLQTHCKLIEKDWFTIDEHYDTIIADGAINLVGGKLVEHLSNFCNTLVIRFFTKKIDGMQYATHFRENTPMLIPNYVMPTQSKCVMLVWKF